MFRAPGTLKVGKATATQEGFADRLVKRRSETSLGGGDLAKLVQLPPDEDLLDWLYQHCTDFYQELQLLYGLLDGHCTDACCPTMSAGPKFEYKWADGKEVKKPLRCSAPRYVAYLMAWVATLWLVLHLVWLVLRLVWLVLRLVQTYEARIYDGDDDGP